jgi:UDP-N-acetylmuramoyl-L-alanyl-D-glutamate--2,6-diaminopimelate ligase
MMTSSQLLPGKSLNELLDGISPDAEIPSVMIRSITSNSREVTQDTLFVALEGTQVHGIDFAIDAAKSGAVVILYDASDEYCLQRIPLLKKQAKTHWLGVDHLNRLNGEIVSRFYGEPSRQMTIIGVTGTDGKTSVTHLLTQALGRLGKTAGSIGTLGYGIGNQVTQTSHTTPDAVSLQSYFHQFQQNGCQYVVMEVSSHALHQYRVSGCNIDIAVLTNLGRDHLDYHDSVEEYAAAKAKLFTDFELRSRVINLDDHFGQQLAASFSNEQMIRYSANQAGNTDAEVRLVERVITAQGQDIKASTTLGEIYAHTHLMGDFNIDNTLACIATLISLGFNREEINQAVAELTPIPGRMEKFTGASNYPAVVVDFAHTEQALRACLQTSRQHTSGKLWCVFGCGGDRDTGKRAGMGQAAEQLADRVIITDDNPRTEPAEKIVRDILLGMDNPDKVSVVHSRQAAIEFAINAAVADDLVVIAGKGHEQEQIIGRERLPFSDRHVVQRMMKVSR